MSNPKRDELKKLLAPINKELRIHGGNDNKIKITGLKEGHIDFLLELIKDHLEKYKDFARADLEDFHAEDIKGLVNYKMPVNIHEIDLPESFSDPVSWKIAIGRLRFGSTQVILEINNWEITDSTLVG